MSTTSSFEALVPINIFCAGHVVLDGPCGFDKVGLCRTSTLLQAREQHHLMLEFVVTEDCCHKLGKVGPRVYLYEVGM